MKRIMEKGVDYIKTEEARIEKVSIFRNYSLESVNFFINYVLVLVDLYNF